MSDRGNPKNEGHTREWQARARVVLDAKKAARTEASPNQSPVSDDEHKEGEENNRNDRDEKREKDDRFY
jgi:hypothetical protein